MAVPATTGLPPSVDDLKTWSRVDFGSLDAPYTDDDLQVRLDRACDYLTAYTGRPMDDTMPPPLVNIAEEAIQLRVEQIVFQEQPDYVETGNDDLIQSFSAGNYSETRHEPGRSRYAGATTGLPDLNPNGILNRDMWLLCTQTMQDYWRYIMQGTAAPAIETTEVDWGNYDGLYPYSYGVGAFQGPPLLDPGTWGA
jgi:hypothetical protein